MIDTLSESNIKTVVDEQVSSETLLNIKTVAYEHVSSEILHSDISVSDKPPIFSQQTLKPIEVIQEVASPEVSKPNQPVKNKKARRSNA